MCTFTNRLKYLRKERGLTQDELARLAEVNVKTIKRYEGGNYIPSESSKGLINIAEVFGVYPEWLLTGKGFKNAWEELEESAKTHTTHKWVVDAHITAYNELKTSILKYYKLDYPIVDTENMTPKQREQIKRRDVMINNIMNYMEMAVASYRIGIEELI